MKRLLALIFAGLMFVCLFACSEEVAPTVDTEVTAEEETTVSTTTTKGTSTTTKAPTTTTKESSPETGEPTTTTTAPTTTTKVPGTTTKKPTTTTKKPTTTTKKPTATTKAPTTTTKQVFPAAPADKYASELRASVTPDPLFEEDPATDKYFNVLLVGNSYSTHWIDELAYLFNIAGNKNVRICSIYHSGAVFEEHWTWHLNGEKVEELHIARPGYSTKEQRGDVNWEYCTNIYNWDVISFQQGNRLVGATERYRTSVDEWLPQIFTYLYERFPKATYYWQQNWAHEVGGTADEPGYHTQRTERFTAWHRDESLRAAQKFGLYNVPLGSAWMLVRHDPLFYEGNLKSTEKPTRSLTMRVQTGGSQKGLVVDDLSHDGDVGGGSYLNALVWYEMLTHESVYSLPNTAPTVRDKNGVAYTLTQEQILKLKEAAHSVVLDDFGQEWYKK